jgi:hypothetical protein
MAPAEKPMSPTGWIEEANGADILDQDIAFGFGIAAANMEFLPRVTSFPRAVVILYLT